LEQLIEKFLRILGQRVEYHVETTTRHAWSFYIGPKAYTVSLWRDAKYADILHVRFFPRDMDEKPRELLCNTSTIRGIHPILDFIEKCVQEKGETL
jgi:hypothetical protein